MTDDLTVQKIEYYRQVRPPTLKQYLYRRAVKEAMTDIKGQDGVTINPETNHPIPKSALAARDALKGLTTEKILEKHPEWKEDYAKDILAQR